MLLFWRVVGVSRAELSRHVSVSLCVWTLGSSQELWRAVICVRSTSIWELISVSAPVWTNSSSFRHWSQTLLQKDTSLSLKTWVQSEDWATASDEQQSMISGRHLILQGSKFSYLIGYGFIVWYLDVVFVFCCCCFFAYRDFSNIILSQSCEHEWTERSWLSDINTVMFLITKM